MKKVFFSAIAIAATLNMSAAKPSKNPNIILILSDDQGWGATSVIMDDNIPASASDFMQTPNLERLASKGMRFTNGYACHPNCSPSRAAIQTGKSPAKLHMTDIIERGGGSTRTGNKMITPKIIRGLPFNDITIAELIKQYKPEYATAHFGKWHMGSDGPQAHGYDISDGKTTNREGNQKYADNPKDIFGITQRGNQWMSEQVKQEKPFFMMLAHYATHMGLESKASTLAKYKTAEPGVRHNNPEYAAMTDDLDAGVGLVLDKVKELGIDHNTYIIYLADNGAFPFQNPENTNGPIKGWKATLWEGGIRSPFIISGPGIKSNSICRQRVVGWDLYPTISDWLGIKDLPQGLEGGSLKPLLENSGEGIVKRDVDVMVFHWPHYVLGKGGVPSTVMFKDSFKIHRFYETGELRLYNIIEDYGETRVLNDTHPELLKVMIKSLDDYMLSIDAGFPKPNPNYKADTDPANKHIEVINGLMLQ